MPWKETSAMTQRFSFFEQYQRQEDTLSDLARKFGISRKTAYKWIERHKMQGLEGLLEKSRKPHITANATAIEKETEILKTRERFPA
jgi:transposase-like protein